MKIKARHIIWLSICASALVACSKSDISADSPKQDKITVLIGQSIAIGSRTSIADDGSSAIWSGGDKIAVWAEADDTYALEGETFTMWHYNDAFTSAIFSAEIYPMASGTYTYYATYPEPTSIAGTTARYTLPAEQQAGSFCGDCDIMVASPVTANALTEGETANLNFCFSHKMHALKINIPEGGNLLGKPITRLEFTFPTAVTGDVEVDITNPTAAASLVNGSNTLILDIPEGADEGDSVWGIIFPTDISGSVTYTAYAGGYKSFPRSIYISKVAQQAHISPMSLSIPELYRITEITLSTGTNYLGEKVESVSLVNENGEILQTQPTGSDNKYVFSFEGEFDDSAFSGKPFQIRFESAHAIINKPYTMPTITAYTPNALPAPVDVPYLFEENFATIGDLSSNDTYATGSTGSMSGKSFLDGWSGARFGAKANTAIRLACRRETSARYNARVDSAPLANLKAGASVGVEITFNYGMTQQYGGISGKALGQTCYLGHVESASVFKSGDKDGTNVTQFSIASSINTGEYVMPYSYTYSFSGASSASRLTWRTECESNAGLNNNTIWLYVDNVTVKIAQ